MVDGRLHQSAALKPQGRLCLPEKSYYRHIAHARSGPAFCCQLKSDPTATTMVNPRQKTPRHGRNEIEVEGFVTLPEMSRKLV
jgi:hypothetical protein